jgi:hypothetical protein
MTGAATSLVARYVSSAWKELCNILWIHVTTAKFREAIETRWN